HRPHGRDADLRDPDPERRVAVMCWFARALYRREEGSALLIAVILSSVVATLSVLMLAVVVHTDKASARGRHWEQALGVAESGIEQAMAKIQTANGNYSGTFSGSTPEGTYSVSVARGSRNSYTI